MSATRESAAERARASSARAASRRRLCLPRAGFVQRAPVHGAYYLFVDYRGVPALQGLDPTAAAMKMTTDFKVACVPGDNFYLGRAKGDAECGQKYIRFTFVRSRLQRMLDPAGVALQYCGEGPSAISAPGNYRAHLERQRRVVEDTLG